MKEAKKGASKRNSGYKKRPRARSDFSENNELGNEDENDVSDFSGYKLPLFNADRTK